MELKDVHCSVRSVNKTSVLTSHSQKLILKIIQMPFPNSLTHGTNTEIFVDLPDKMVRFRNGPYFNRLLCSRLWLFIRRFTRCSVSSRSVGNWGRCRHCCGVFATDCPWGYDGLLGSTSKSSATFGCFMFFSAKANTGYSGGI